MEEERSAKDYGPLFQNRWNDTLATVRVDDSAMILTGDSDLILDD